MKSVGLNISSPSLQIFPRKRSVFSMHPRAVPVMTASGEDIPDLERASIEVTTALFRRSPILLACIGGMKSLKTGSALLKYSPERATGESIHSSESGFWQEIWLADFMYTFRAAISIKYQVMI
jgi:hypothetical protein